MDFFRNYKIIYIIVVIIFDFLFAYFYFFCYFSINIYIYKKVNIIIFQFIIYFFFIIFLTFFCFLEKENMVYIFINKKFGVNFEIIFVKRRRCFNFCKYIIKSNFITIYDCYRILFKILQIKEKIY